MPRSFASLNAGVFIVLAIITGDAHGATWQSGGTVGIHTSE